LRLLQFQISKELCETHEVRESNVEMNQRGKTKEKGHWKRNREGNNRKPDAPDVEYFVQTNHTKERPVMNILASIEHFVQLRF